MIGASAALTISPRIPFLGPTGSVRVAKVQGEFVINPTHEELQKCSLELVVSGTESAITMLEGKGREVSEEDLLQAILASQRAIGEIVRIQKELAEALGVRKTPPAPAGRVAALLPARGEVLRPRHDRPPGPRQVRPAATRWTPLFQQIVAEQAKPEGPTAAEVKNLCYRLERKACRMLIMSGKREDGRGAEGPARD